MGDMSREPSMEDILSSIRRVIARDDAPGAMREARAATGDDILDLNDEEAETAVFETAPTVEELVSTASADAARQSLEALTAAIAPAVTAAVVHTAPVQGRSMEDVVLEALRPMLKTWLDTNLPAMVEAMVAKEISRITGRRL